LQVNRLAAWDSGGFSNAQFSGLDVCGSLPYHGSRIPQLTNAYIFGDFDGAGNVWALRRTNGAVTVERLAGQVGLAAFGAIYHDPTAKKGDASDVSCPDLAAESQRVPTRMKRKRY